jgi:phosphatidylglycerophosphatase A
LWAAGVAETELKKQDPGPVVIDEVAGQLVTLLLTGVGWKGAIAGFFIFRVLDILKPFPARRFERLHGGLGIMADDLMAGVYGLGLMMLLVHFWPGMW